MADDPRCIAQEVEALAFTRLVACARIVTAPA